MSSSERFDVVIIGAGQAGVAMGHDLAQRGINFVILDAAERIGDTWRRRWDSLRLFTPARYDGLPGLRYPGPRWSFPAKDEIADFIEDYARRFELPVRTRVRVDRLSVVGDRFVVAAGDQRIEAGNVVVATGSLAIPRVPAFATELDPALRQLHCIDYRNPAQLRDGPVLVVGAGNSGAEIALEVSHSRRTFLSGRDTGEETPFRTGSVPDRLLTPAMWFLLSRVLTTRTAAGRKLRDKGISMGLPLVRVKPQDLARAHIQRVPRTAGVERGHPVLDDGRVLEVANLIWCTGFQADLSWIDLPIFDDGGMPLHERGVVSTQPGLYFLGQFFLSSLTSSLIGGVGRDSHHIAQLIDRRR